MEQFLSQPVDLKQDLKQDKRKGSKKRKSKERTTSKERGKTRINDEMCVKRFDSTYTKESTYTVELESRFAYAVGAVLAGASGAVDAIGFSMFGSFMANQSGNVIQVGMRTAGNTPGDPMVAANLVAFFVLGCMICGLLIPRNRPKFPVGDDLYTIAFFLQAIFLIFSAYFKSTPCGMYIGCVACGLMNAITTSWSDGPMRTTHATGPSTEVGLNLGRIIGLLIIPDANFDKQCKADMKACVRKFRLNVVLVLSFMVGGYAGALLYRQMGGDALLLPAMISIGIAVLNLALPAIEVVNESASAVPGMEVDSLKEGGVLTEPLLTAASAPGSDINRCELFGYMKQKEAKEKLPRFDEDGCDSDATTMAAASNHPSLSTLAASSNYPSVVSMKGAYTTERSCNDLLAVV
eukprot:gnl/MRDRNA2_/MRDRNA2_31817_c0_seq1.p1 gnl/MRDRNA2_/MRDRNA2_31817_c0~~gnl/MRDRNA2_/MRDRNA2_31817_c0_seq1.p1  ORF type:complete len:407 (-),score=65.66 gnl/MRDRNA2_/MRDRNA2_31817_c0_seq1:53-1273(-)